MNAITVESLFSKYRDTRDFLKLSPNSKRVYEGYMRAAVNDYFLVMNKASMITPTMVDDLYEKLKSTKGLNHATMFMRVMRLIWGIGVRKGWVNDNPFKEMGLQSPEARETVWEPDHLKLYLKVATDKHYYDLRTLVSFCYVLGQRPGDIRALTKANFKNELTEIRFIQQKTKRKMHMPLTTDLIRYAKAAFATRDKLIVASEKIINEQHHEILKETGLPPGLQIRDLRRTALTETMSNGGTDAEGQALSGHNDRDMLSIYAPPNFNMAKMAIAKRFGTDIFPD